MMSAPSEMRWKDADSARFLRHAAGRIAARGGVLANADVTFQQTFVPQFVEAFKA